ncbi:MAG: ATP-binding protein [Planctomycetota bacterium]
MAVRKGGLAASMAAAMDGLQLGLVVVQGHDVVLANEVVRGWLGGFAAPARLGDVLGKLRARQVLAWLEAGAAAPLRIEHGRGRRRRTLALRATERRHEGRPASLVLLRDVSAAVQDEQELESRVLHMQRLGSIGRLSTTIAHEFGNFLQVLLGAATLARQEAGEAGVTEHLARIEAVARRATALCDQLRALSRKAPRRSERVLLQDVARSMRDLEGGFAGQGITLALDLDDDAPPVLGDPCQLQQALLNLLLNARDAMPDGGTVRVRLARDGDELELAVADEGPGIPAALRERVFEPFFTTKGEQGSGMGLGVVAGIAEAHGGGVELDGEDGGGACFRLRLPVARGARHRARGPRRAAAATNGHAPQARARAGSLRTRRNGAREGSAVNGA